jgi:hypothetical protein
MLFEEMYRFGGCAPFFAAEKLIRDPTRDAAPGATSHRWIGTTAIARTLKSINQDTVMRGNAQYNARVCDGSRCTEGDTLSSVMFATVSLFSISATGVAVRAIWVIALALIALAAIDRMKPATPRRPIPVRVDNKSTPLYREPNRDNRRRAVLQLSGGAILLGAVLASLVGFLFAILLEVVGGLLRS